VICVPIAIGTASISWVKICGKCIYAHSNQPQTARAKNEIDSIEYPYISSLQIHSYEKAPFLFVPVVDDCTRIHAG
jgi:hypothetical protein